MRKMLELPYRYAILVIGFFALTSIYSNYMVITFTFICMDRDVSQTIAGTNRSIYSYDENERSLINWSHGAGTVIGSIPMSMIYIRCGAKYPLLVAGILSCISTAFIPLAASFGWKYILPLRFLQGLAYSANFGSIGVITVRWAPIKETALFIATLTSFGGLGSLITNVFSGLYVGWQYAFYFHSILGVLCFLAWAVYYEEDPRDTKRVSWKELERINLDKSAAYHDNRTNIPYKKIFTSPIVLIILLNALVELSSIHFLAFQLPTYFSEVLGFDVVSTGNLVAFVMSFNVPIRIIASIFSDKLTIISEKTKILIYNSLSVGLTGVLLSSLALISADYRWWTFVIATLFMCFAALNSGGFYKCAALHTREYAHVVLASIQFMKCVALFTGPLLMKLFVTDRKNRFEWIPAFTVLGSSMFIVNIISMFVPTVKPAKWTERDEKHPKQMTNARFDK